MQAPYCDQSVFPLSVHSVFVVLISLFKLSSNFIHRVPVSREGKVFFNHFSRKTDKVKKPLFGAYFSPFVLLHLLHSCVVKGLQWPWIIFKVIVQCHWRNLTWLSKNILIQWIFSLPLALLGWNFTECLWVEDMCLTLNLIPGSQFLRSIKFKINFSVKSFFGFYFSLAATVVFIHKMLPNLIEIARINC